MRETVRDKSTKPSGQRGWSRPFLKQVKQRLEEVDEESDTEGLALGTDTSAGVLRWANTWLA